MGEVQAIPVGDPIPWKGDEDALPAGANAPVPIGGSEPAVLTPKLPKAGRTPFVPAGPAPRRGLRGFLWNLVGRRLYARWGWNWLAALSKRERLLNALDELWQMRTVRKTIAFVGSSGGCGKTTAATWFTAAAAFAFKGNVALVDADENAGHAADRLRIPRTISLREFVSRRREFWTIAGLLSEADRHRQSGAFVIGSQASGKNPIDQAGYEEALRILQDNMQLVLCDCGSSQLSPTNLGSVNLADELVFTGNFLKSESLDDIVGTMKSCEVSDGFVAIFGASPKQRLAFAKRYAVPPENVFIFPVNRYMSNPDNPVLLERLPLRIQVILFESLRALVAKA